MKLNRKAIAPLTALCVGDILRSLNLITYPFFSTNGTDCIQAGHVEILSKADGQLAETQQVKDNVVDAQVEVIERELFADNSDLS